MVGNYFKNITFHYGINTMMKYRLWKGRKVQLWQKGKQYKKLIGIGFYKGAERRYGFDRWIKLFEIIDGQYKGNLITELECEWNPVNIESSETTGLS